MNIVELIEIALANSGARRVEVAALEPAEVSTEAVSGLAQLVSELADNAVAFSEPGETVRITGLFDQGDYLISISDRGVGIPHVMLTELNRLLEDPSATHGPEPKMGISLVARLAARHGIDVRLVPGVPGTTARVVVPDRLITVSDEKPAKSPEPARSHRLPPRQSPLSDPPSPETDQVFAPSGRVEERVELNRFEPGRWSGSGVVAMSEEARNEAEAFLERVFAPLVNQPGMTERPVPRPTPDDNGTGNRRPSKPEAPRQPSPSRETGGTVTDLRMRVPGENFSLIEDDPSTIAAEGAIDIRSALSKYEQGRRNAQKGEASGDSS